MSVTCSANMAGTLTKLLGGQMLPGMSVSYISARIADAEIAVRAMGITEQGAFDGKVKQIALTSVRSDIRNNRLLTKKALQLVQGNSDHVVNVAGGDAVAGLRSLLVGVVGNFENSRNSVGLAQKNFSVRYIAEIDASLRKADTSGKLYNSFWSGELDEEVFRAAHMKRDNDVAGLSKISPDAIAILDVLQTHAETRRAEANRLGADIGQHPGRVARQMHSEYDIRHAARTLGMTGKIPWTKRLSGANRGGTAEDAAAWIGFVMENLDHDRTFPPDVGTKAEKEAWLQVIFNEFSNGFKQAYTLKDPLDGTRQGLKITRALEEERVLNFTAKGEFEYMKMFGMKSLRDTVMQETHHMGHRMGLMNILGADPKANLDAIVARTKEQLDPNSKEYARFEKYTSGFERGFMDSKLGKEYMTISGATNRVVSDVGAVLGSSLRAFEHVTKLGFAPVSSVTDIANISADIYMQHGTKHPVFALIEGVMAPVRGMADKEYKAFAESAGHGLEVAMMASIERISAMDSPKGFTAKTLNTFFKWNGLNLWTESARRGMYISNTNYMAKIINQRGEMSPVMRKLLLDYGIHERDLDFMKNHVAFHKMKGSEFFDPTQIKHADYTKVDLSDVAMERLVTESKRYKGREAEVLQASIKEAKISKLEDLDRRFRAYFLDRNDMGVVTPGAETAAMVHGGHARGTMTRELRELFFQFKQFPLMMTNIIMKRNMMGIGPKGKGMMGMNANGELNLMAFHLTALLGFGALSLTLKDALKNREIYVPKNKEEASKFFMASFMHGGSMGLYGDFLLGDIGDVGDRVLRLMGPVAGDALDYKDLAKEVYMDKFSDEYTDTGRVAWRALRDDVPFANIWHSKAILDYLIMYNLHEMFDPGGVERSLESQKKYRDGRGMLFSPFD